MGPGKERPQRAGWNTARDTARLADGTGRLLADVARGLGNAIDAGLAAFARGPKKRVDAWFEERRRRPPPEQPPEPPSSTDPPRSV